MSERFKNQSGLINPDVIATTNVLVIGAGAIGSFYTMTLAKMGCEHITVIDDDKLEEHNISNQMYPIFEVGKHKVNALKSVCEAYGEVSISPVVGKYPLALAGPYKVIVSAVDNMDVRRIIWDSIKAKTDGLFIDGRMGAQVYRSYAIDLAKPEHKEFYEKSLYPQSKATADRCSQKSIIYTVLQVCGDMLAMTKKYLCKEQYPNEIIRDCLMDTFSVTRTEALKFEEVDASEPEVVAA